MLFTSMEFLFVFLVGTLGGYFLLPPKARNYWLFLASLFFYAWGEPNFVLVMLLSIEVNYVGALCVQWLGRRSPRGTLALVLTLCADFGLLFVYKYMNFVTRTLADLFPGAGIEVTQFVLPVGISFFTFQAASYVIDVYRGTRAQENFCFLGLYIALFPQLIAGPIVRYTAIEKQLTHRTVTWDGFAQGVLRFLRGFNKKMLLANVLAQAADAAWASLALSTAQAWLGAVCYTLQIFFDFGGYSDMAIGLGQMLGFRFPENFNYPYVAKTVTEFWRRWHISLSTWFRDYVYFPLGGSRVGSRARLLFNLFLVWLCTGIWHGANWTFILWGVGYGLIIMAEKLTDMPRRSWRRTPLTVLYRLFTLLVVTVGWVVFRAPDLPAAQVYLRTMFGRGGTPAADDLFWFYLREYAVFVLMGLLCSTPVWAALRRALSAKGPAAARLCSAAACAAQLVLFLVSISALVMNAHNPFIYFNF